MLPFHIIYPAFEANQVLSNEHLNQLFAYLDEQERLPRTNLIGIGIVCGLEPIVADGGNSIRISKGCGVSSEGYLIVWDDVGALEWYRPYIVPERLAYHEFEDRSALPVRPFPLWELMPDRNNDPEALQLSSDFLTGDNRPAGEEDEKILLLFLEHNAQSNRNCTPNSCDDKGTTVTVTARPLLIRRRDIDQLQARIRALGPETEAYFSLAKTFGTRLGLPELRMPRFDVEVTALSSTASVFEAFQRAMERSWIEQVADALTAAYMAFRPLLRDFPTNPFSTLRSDWAFLHDGGIMAQKQYVWYQYFYDHLEHTLQAYNEFRERGLAVLGLCCPDSRLFPRHLILANVGAQPPGYEYRHTFVSSPLYAEVQGAMAELRILFQRLLALIRGLELPPQVALFQFNNTFSALRRANATTEIRITPSALALPLSHKAIPYHYEPDPLYQYWNYKLSRQGKENLNLGYRSGSWNTTDAFVHQPLRYDLEPHNFLRIEGHIGQYYQTALSELIAQKNRYRLPIEIVALKTGRNPDDITLSEDLAGCHFQDLDALYTALREELLCQLCTTVVHFYNAPILTNEEIERTLMIPQLPFLRECDPNFRYTTDTVGEHYENNLSQHTDTSPSYAGVPFAYMYHIFYIFRMVKLSEALSVELSGLDLDAFTEAYNSLQRHARQRNDYLLQQLNDAGDRPANLPAGVDYEELSDQLDQLLYACKIDSIRSVYIEYQRRSQQLREALLLAFFARKHPGLQHKAGVPPGGTFIMVYHGEDQRGDTTIRRGRFVIQGRVVADGEPVVGANILTDKNHRTTTDSKGHFTYVSTQLPVRLRVSYRSYKDVQLLVTDDTSFIAVDLAQPNDNGKPNIFNELGVGTVIADFYLPYLCCSDCQPIQFVLPKVPPTFSWEQIGCTNADGFGLVGLTPAGGTPPYQFTRDGGKTWEDLVGEPVDLGNGTHVRIRDAEGTESISQTVRLHDPLILDTGVIECSEDGTEFTVQINISGGQPPYTLTYEDKTVNVPANQHGGATFPSGQGGEVVVRDSSEPACEARLLIDQHECEPPCTLPCNGLVMNCGYPFWLQRPTKTDSSYGKVTLEVVSFVVNGDASEQLVEFNAEQLRELSAILNPGRDLLNASTFSQFWNSHVPEANLYIQKVLEATFGAEAGGLLELTYNPAGVNGFTTLHIERYACFDFVLQLKVAYRGTQEQLNSLDWTYTSKGVELSQVMTEPNGNTSEVRTELTPYNCIQKDRCNSNAPDQTFCKEPQKIEIQGQSVRGDRLQYVLSLEPALAELPKLWYIEGGFPAAGTGENFSVRFPHDGRTYEVRVIAVDPATTCASVATTQIEVPDILI